MLDTIRKSAVTMAALAALGLGGAAIAGAADDSSSSSGAASSPSRPARMDPPALSSAVAAKVKAAALAEVPGATVLRTEAGGPYGTPYHAHIRTSDGAPKVVLVDSSPGWPGCSRACGRSRGHAARRAVRGRPRRRRPFTATAVQADPGRGFRGGRGRHGGPGRARRPGRDGA
jgi:hypothetical protein